MATLDTERIRRMSAVGLTTREIASLLGCSHSRIGQILAQLGPIPIEPVSIRAQEGMVTIKTDQAQIVAVAIKRALERAGIEVRQ